MTTMTLAAAKATGYRSITEDICPTKEKEIMRSMERSLGRTGAIWIAQENGKVQAGRLAPAPVPAPQDELSGEGGS